MIREIQTTFVLMCGNGIVGNRPGVNTLFLCVIQNVDQLDLLQLVHLHILPLIFTRPPS